MWTLLFAVAACVADFAESDSGREFNLEKFL